MSFMFEVSLSKVSVLSLSTVLLDLLRDRHRVVVFRDTLHVEIVIGRQKNVDPIPQVLYRNETMSSSLHC